MSILMWVVLVLLVVVSAFCAIYGLAKSDILWTIVEQGWCKIVLKWGKYHRTLKPGLRWVGIPGMYALYKRKMTFLKSVTDKDGKAQAEPHDDPSISSFKTTQYPYAFPFINMEDSHGLPLSGVVAGDAVVEDYEKAFFLVSDWYSSMNAWIMEEFRDVIAQVSYDDDIVGRNLRRERVRETISQRLWARLTQPGQNNGPSIAEELRNDCGIRLGWVQLISIDPPENYRSATLAPYLAERDRDAAKLEAEASATRFNDTNQALKLWLKDQKKNGQRPTSAQIEAKQNELRERALAKTTGYQQIHVRGLENATTAVVGGGNAGMFFGGGKGGGKGRDRGENQGREGGYGKKRRGDGQSDEDKARAVQAIKDEAAALAAKGG